MSLVSQAGVAQVKARIISVALISSLAASPAWAGVYTDDLSKCLVESTTAEDRTALVKWMFTAASAHPAIRSLSTVTTADLDSANAATGALFTRLLTESCKPQAQKALRFEGPATIQLSFTVLGQVAGAELFSNPAVTQSMAGLEKYVDSKRLEALTAESLPGG
jgi:hypothetical protein